MQRLAAQIEIAMRQADLFRIVRFTKHRQRQLGGFRLDGNFARHDLDLTRGQIRVHEALIAGHDLAFQRDHALRTQALNRAETR